MGNDQSQHLALDLDEKAVEVGEYWTHYSATTTNSGITQLVSVFIGEPLADGPLWVSQTPLEKIAKHLMVFRHPCILKYISSWHKNSKFFLTVEHVKPLSHMFSSQNSLQICIGLYSVLKALCFLHEKARVSHNNVCVACIYVTKDGDWKLGGMEYCCKYGSLTVDYLKTIKTYRCDKTLDPNEEKHLEEKDVEKEFIDLYAFGVLAVEILASRGDEDIPALVAFRELCKNELQDLNVSKRPKLSSLLKHPFFSNDFVVIYSSLLEIALKSEDNKKAFFSMLPEKLRQFDETVVAKQLGGLLLSRLVLLDRTAQINLLPLVLHPRQGDEKADGLFSSETFNQYLVPRLLQIFCVRDAQIRVLLLNHFANYMFCFSKEELQYQILPELLLGIKDTNNQLVSVTLRALADLVQILGAEVVIGGKRAKLFNDGRPKPHHIRPTHSRPAPEPPILHSSDVTSIGSDTSTSEAELNLANELPERPRPDGEENELSSEDVELSAEEELDSWEDWDANEANVSVIQSKDVSANNLQVETNETSVQLSLNTLRTTNELSLSGEQGNLEGLNGTKQNLVKKVPVKLMPDIFELDIKTQAVNSELNEMNFFEDMEPVINSSNKFLLPEADTMDSSSTDDGKVSQRLDLSVRNDSTVIEGWGDDDWD